MAQEFGLTCRNRVEKIDTSEEILPQGMNLWQSAMSGTSHP
jgi:hypothetical protein